MKIALGGKISIALALIYGCLLATLLLVPDDAGNVQRFGGMALFYLSFPIAWLSSMFSGGHEARPSRLIIYLVLLIPNCFLLGYSIAGVFHLFRRVCRPSRFKA